MAPQDSKITVEILQSANNRTQSLRKNTTHGRPLITDIVINTLLGRVTRHPAGMHCPAGDDAFVSSTFYFRSYHTQTHEIHNKSATNRKVVQQIHNKSNKWSLGITSRFRQFRSNLKKDSVVHAVCDVC